MKEDIKKNLIEKGVSKFLVDKNIMLNFSTDLEIVSENMKDCDVFRTKLGDIKQLQNIHKYFDTTDFNEMITDRLGIEKYEILNNQYFCKPSGYKMTSSHQDNAYFESNENIVTVWVPLHDVDFKNSCMCYVEGSHKNGIIKHEPIGTNIRVRTGTKGLSLYCFDYKISDHVPYELKFGEAVVHDKNSVHLSTSNMSDDYRYAITSIIKIK